MKTILFTGLLIHISLCCLAQQDTLYKEDPYDGKIFTQVESMPQFPGGDKGLIMFMQNNIVYPPDARENGIQGDVYVTFTIDASGKASDAKILKSVWPSIDNEAISLVNKMPLWTPGTQNGRKVIVQYNLPIRFTLSNSSEESNYQIGLELHKKKDIRTQLFILQNL